jgi:hypothetical protein
MITAKNSAFIGVTGYVAPKDMKDIKENGQHLVYNLDPSDSVEIPDSFSCKTPVTFQESL